MCAQARRPRAWSPSYIGVRAAVPDENPPRATRRSAARRRSAAPPPAKAPPASARRCRTTATARRTSTWPTPRIAHRWPPDIRSAACSWASTSAAPSPTPSSSPRRRASTPPRSPRTPSAQSRGVLEAVRLVLERAGARRRAGRALRARHDGRHERAARGAHGAHRADRDRGLHRRVELGRQARPHLYRLCQAPPAAAGRRRAALRGARADGARGPLRPLDPAAARELVADARARRRRRRSPCACCTPTPTPRTSGCSASCSRELLPGVHVSLSQRARRHVPRVRARRHHRARRRALAAAGRLPAAALARTPARSGLPEPQIMQSSGGLTRRRRAGAHAALTVLSGPAGGVGGALAAGRARRRARRALLRHGRHLLRRLPDRRRRGRRDRRASIAGRPLALPALDIHTVGAGGGSIAWRDAGGALRVGPRSAGADPGPACYGRGGERADGHRRQPAARPAAPRTRRWPAACARPRCRRAGRRARSRRELGPRAGCAAPRASCASPRRRCSARCAWSPSSAASIRAASRCWRSAAPGPLHAAALASALGISRMLCPRASGVLSRARPRRRRAPPRRRAHA